jgi:hypothetical protein
VNRVVLGRADDCRHGLEQPPWLAREPTKGSVGCKRGKSSGN